jgi:hypothetical protein
MPIFIAQEVPRWRPQILPLKILIDLNLQEILCLAALVPPTAWYAMNAVTVRRNMKQIASSVEHEEETLVQRGRTRVRKISQEQNLS